MDIPEILKGEVHLPLTANTTVLDAVNLANGFYQTQLDASHFRTSVPVWETDGRLTMTLVSVDDDSTGIRFVNKATGGTAGPSLSLTNPLLNATEKLPWLTAPIQLHSAEEIAFLNAVEPGTVYPLNSCNTLAWKLAQLLNEYEVLGRWVAGTYGELSTAGFELVFKGHSLDVPDGYLVDFSPMIAIIRTHHGEQQGYLCLKS